MPTPNWLDSSNGIPVATAEERDRGKMVLSGKDEKREISVIRPHFSFSISFATWAGSRRGWLSSAHVLQLLI